MSAPHTNIEKQKRRHIVPLIGMIVILVVVGIGFVWWMQDETDDPQMPGEVLPMDDDPQPAASAQTQDNAAPGTQ